MNYSIRSAVCTDVAEIIRLCEEHAGYEQTTYKPNGKAEMLSQFLFSNNPKLHCLLAEMENKIIGYATYMFEFSTWEAGFYLHMDCLYLRPHARGLGIGEALLKQIARAAKENNCTVIQWQTPASNERAIKFYYRIGAASKEKLRFYINDEVLTKLSK
jgi:ribosomal protein S18 acetylase RimI-like enzyme